MVWKRIIKYPIDNEIYPTNKFDLICRKILNINYTIYDKVQIIKEENAKIFDI